MPRPLTPFLAILAFGIAFTAGTARAGSFEALFAPSAELWERWEAHDAGSTVGLDHGAWAAFLQRHVQPGTDGVSRIDYGAVGPSDRALVDRYIGDLVSRSVSMLNRAEQRAYWINLYNALTVKLVLGAYPVASIRDIDISPGLLADGPWGRKLVRIEGEPVSLNDIEHRILRPIWADPRIHYAVNCAAIGCPNLVATAFTAANMDALLDAAAREYVNNARGVNLTNEGLAVSSIYVWFAEDFCGTDESVIAHLGRYAEPTLAARLETRTRIDGDGYDWALNDAR